MTKVIGYFGTGVDAGEHSFLSNFYDCGGGWTVEHEFQAAKTDDSEWARRIRTASSPGEAKRLGRRCPLRATWDAEKDVVMLVLLRIKFSMPMLREQLRATGDAILIEGNHWGDRYWGVCDGHGENRLGILLQQVRDELA